MISHVTSGRAGHGTITRLKSAACSFSIRSTQLRSTSHVLETVARHNPRVLRCRAPAAAAVQVQELPAQEQEAVQQANNQEDEQDNTVVEDVVQGLLSLLWIGALALSVVAAFKFSTFQSAKVAGSVMQAKSPLLISAAASFVGVLFSLFARIFLSSWAVMRYAVFALAAFSAWFFAG